MLIYLIILLSDINISMSSGDWLREGSYVDFKDRDGIWEVGIILEKNEYHIKIRSEGWASKYDQVLSIQETKMQASSKIKPFRSVIRGYRGVLKSPGIRQHWKYTNEGHEIRLKRLQKFMATIKQKSAHELTQFVRGQHYFYVDFLMSNTYTSTLDLLKIYQYFKMHIKLAKYYIQQILQKGVFKWFNHQQSNEWTIAYSQCYYQIFDSLYTIAGLYQRLRTFLIGNDRFIRQIADIHQSHQNYIANQFVQQIEEIAKQLIIKTYQEITNQNNLKLPFSFIYSILQLVLAMQRSIELYDEKEVSNIISTLFAIMQKGISNLQTKDMTHPQIDAEIQILFYRARGLLRKYDQQNNLGSWIEGSRVKIGLLLINCDKLQRKLKGISRLYEESDRLLGPANEQARRNFGQLLKEGKFFQRIFQENEHPEVFKKAMQLVRILYKTGILNINHLLYIWSKAMGKQQSIIKLMYRFWIDTALSIQFEHMVTYVDRALVLFNPQGMTRQRLYFCLEFAYTAAKCHALVRHKKQSLALLEERVVQILKTTFFMLAMANQIPENSLQTLSKAILLSSECQNMTNGLYNNLQTRKYFRISLLLLKEIHQNSKRSVVSENAVTVLIGCLQYPEITSYQTSIIVRLINQAMISATDQDRNCPLTSQQFKQLWIYFRKAPQQIKMPFYQWVLSPSRFQIEHATINPSFPAQLKRYALDQVLGDQKAADYANLTRKQLQIAIQLFTVRNFVEGKLQKKTYFNGCRTVYKLKSIQLSQQSMLWAIFQKCKQQQVVNLLSHHLIALHFYFSSSLQFQLRRTRIDQLMNRVISYLKRSYAQGNNRLLKHSLILLRQIIGLVKQEKGVHMSSERPSTAAKFKLNIYFQSNTYPIDVGYEQTVSSVKARLAHNFKLKAVNMKIFGQRQEQLSYDTRDVPICCLSQRVFRVNAIPPSQQTIFKFVLSFITPQIQQILVTMLQSENICTEVYGVLDQLQLSLPKKILLERIGDILSKYPLNARANKFAIFYSFLQVKLYHRLIEQDTTLLPLLNTPNFDRFIQLLSSTITLPNQAVLLDKICILLIKISKKHSILPQNLKIPQRCFVHMVEIANYASSAKIENPRIRDMMQRSFQNCGLLIEQLTSHVTLQFYLKKNNFAIFLEKVFFSYELDEARTFITDRLRKYIIDSGRKMEKQLAVLFIQKLYPGFVKSTGKNVSKGINDFFSLLFTIITHISAEAFNEYVLSKENKSSFYEKVIDFLTNKQNLTQSMSNALLCGHFTILAAIYQIKPELVNAKIIDFILEDCLALAPRPVNNPLCRTPLSIKTTFSLLQRILQYNIYPQQLLQVIRTLEQSHRIPLWRQNGQWNVVAVTEARQQYRGLINPGCICYMNSLLQQLFTIEQFKKFIVNLKFNNIQDKQQPSQLMILQGLKHLFLKMQYSKQNVINPLLFARTIRSSDNKPIIKTNQQMDIDQFSAMLFDRIQTGFSKFGTNNIVRQLFGGTFAHQIVSTECPHQSERQQQFLTISLDVKRTIMQSFHALTHTQILDGQNKYFCEKCDKKVRAKKAQTLKKIPPYLILCLKRFEFNFDYDAKIKINDYCEFPSKLNLKPYTSFEHENTNAQESQQTIPKQYADQNFMYKLRGVVVHTGSADSGHYYSFIQTQKGSWFEFNDEEVLPFDLNRLPDEAFGSRQGYQQCRIRNAYLLIYQKIIKIQVMQQILQEQTLDIIQKINQNNRQIRKQQLLFSQKYQNIIRLLYNSALRLGTGQQEWVILFLSYYFLIRFRREGLQDFLNLSKELQRICTGAHFNRAFVGIFTSNMFLQEFFIYNQIRQKSRIIAHIFYQAMCSLTLQEGENIAQNPHFIEPFNSFRQLFLTHSVVPQLAIAIKKYFEFLYQRRLITALLRLIKQFNIAELFFDYAFDIVKTYKQEQEKFAQNYQSKRITFLQPLSFDGKTYYARNLNGIWKILTILQNVQRQPNNDEEYKLLKKFRTSAQSTISQFPQQKITAVIQQTSSESGMKSMLEYFKIVGMQNRLLTSVQSCLKDFESHRFRPFFVMIYCFVKDPLIQDKNLHKIVDLLFKCYKSNSGYFLQADLFYQWIIKFAYASQTFTRLLRTTYREFLQLIRHNLYKTTVPQSQHFKKNKSLSIQKLGNRYFGITVSTDPKDYQIRYYQMRKQYTQLSEGRLVHYQTPEGQHKNSGNFQAGDPIQYFDNESLRWKKGTIISNNFGYLQSMPDKFKIKLYVWEDSERIRKADEHSQVEEQEEQNESDLSASESEPADD